MFQRLKTGLTTFSGRKKEKGGASLIFSCRNFERDAFNSTGNRAITV